VGVALLVEGERFVLYKAISALTLPDRLNWLPVRGLPRKSTARHAVEWGVTKRTF
jgi:hypothetical protein